MEQIVRKIDVHESATGQETVRQEAGARHEITIEIEAETLERQLKRAVVKRRGHTFEIYCDEAPHLGGDDSAPPPLAYFSAGIAF